MWIFLASSPFACGAERSGSTFVPGSLGDYNAAVIPSQTGIYVRNDIFYYLGSDARTMRNGQINVNLDQSTWVDSVKITLAPGWSFLGATYAAGLNVALVNAHVDSDVIEQQDHAPDQSTHRSGTRTTFSDIFVTPVALSWKLGTLHLAWLEMLTIPSGTYDNNEFVNVSRNYWALDSQLALTWMIRNIGVEISGKGGFIVNTRNEDTDYRTGEEFHLEGLLAKHFSKQFSVGMVGYYYEQLSADTGSGALLGDFEGRALGAGPAARYLLTLGSRTLALTAKWIHEFYAEDRFEGDYWYMCAAIRL